MYFIMARPETPREPTDLTLTYAVARRDSGWYWEVRNGSELVAQGKEDTKVAARVAALRAATNAREEHR
jgi:hypothetical protein